MTLDVERLHAALAPRPFRFYDQVDSTNDIALDWLRQGAAPGSIVLTDEQVKGRGRLGRTWYTPPGTALIVSIILRPQASHLSRVSMLGALAICEMLEGLGATDAGIKWPNDVQLQGRKVSGVLPEAVWAGSHLAGVVLGMGVNVRVEFGGTTLAETAISIEPALGRAVDRVELLLDVLRRLDYWMPQLGTSAFLNAWKQRLTTLGQSVTVTGAAGVVSGLAEALDEAGALLVRDSDGNLHKVIAGDIALGQESH